ncbi:MAG: UvrB/UvrC motif-containing protein [Planctomycetes bacterium]|nr:UvrB/UvrC motif-containing protein [Planctomycetota bacterium]
MYICQLCKKTPATIHLTDIHNNIKKEVHICEACAAAKGFNLQGAAHLPQLLGLAAKKQLPALAPQLAAHIKAKAKEKVVEDDLVCTHCGSSWSAFKERGRLGCPHDYQAFDVRLRPLIASQIAANFKHRNTFHVGKTPGPRREEDVLDRAIHNLEKNLRQAVAEENYEAAAKIKAELDALRQRELQGNG